MSDPETRVFRGPSLREVLPQIREELGPDAVITKQREGVIGGINGWFGKKCIEVEAHAPAAAPPYRQPLRTARPARAIVDAYDTGATASDVRVFEPEELLPRRSVAVAEALRPGATNGALGGIDAGLPPSPPREQAVPFPDPADDEDDFPFADRLIAAIESQEENREAAVSAEYLADVSLIPGPPREPDPKLALERAEVPAALIGQIVAEASMEGTMYEVTGSEGDRVRAVVARRFARYNPRRTGRRRIALIGLRGSGKTLAAARLCHAHVRAGSSVCAVSLEHVRRAVEFVALASTACVEVEIANSDGAVRMVRDRAHADVLIADTPPLDAREPDSIRRVADVVTSLEANEVHLVVPVDADPQELRLLLRELRLYLRVSALIVTNTDDEDLPPSALGIALSERIPVSYLTDGDRPESGLRLADPVGLASTLVA